MDPLSKEVAKKFCEVCDRVYEVWTTHKTLFDENKNLVHNIGLQSNFCSRLSEITQEFCLLQISKLHDKPIQRDSLNLTIEFMVRFGDWGKQQEEIDQMKQKLDDLWNRIKPARNKMLAHNDLETLMSDATLGAFPAGMDDKYFDTLQDFVNKVHDKWFGGPYPFNYHSKTDVEEFLELFERTTMVIDRLAPKA
jgi:hypothetical protein